MTTLMLDNMRARRIAMFGLTLGLLAISIGYLALFPQLETQLQSFAGDLPEFYKAVIGDANFATPEGYVRTQVYALTAPLLAAGVTMSLATAMAKAERDVTLTVTYLAPVSRRSLALAYLGAALCVGLLAGAAVFVGVAIGAPIAGAQVSLGAIAAATVPFVGFTWCAASVAWAAGAATGSPAIAGGAGWGFIAVSFLANSVGEVVPTMDWLTTVSPWGWYGGGGPITDGFDPSSLLLFALAAVVAGVGVILFGRRDLQL